MYYYFDENGKCLRAQTFPLDEYEGLTEAFYEEDVHIQSIKLENGKIKILNDIETYVPYIPEVPKYTPSLQLTVDDLAIQIKDIYEKINKEGK